MIKAYVQSSYVKLDGKMAGVQGESMSRTLQLNFSPEWGELTKRILWLDARGKQVVSQPLIASVDEVLEHNGLVIPVKIPGEALQYSGKAVFIVEGADENGAISLSVMAEMTVSPNDFYKKRVINATEPTQTEMQQLQASIEEAIGVAAADKQAAQAAAAAAAKSEAAAESAANRAATNADMAADSALQARGYAKTAENAALTAQGASQQAQLSQSAAETAKTSAEAAAEAARLSAYNAASEREKAGIARSQAQDAQTRAESAAKTAVAAKDSAETSKTAAEKAKTSAESAKTAAENARKAAEAAKNTAVEASKNSAGISLANKAAVGQLIMVSKVDANGVPTKWEAIDRTHYKYTDYGEMYYGGPPGLNEPISPGHIIGNAWEIMTTTHELEYVMDGVSYVRPASRSRNGSKEYRYIGNAALGGFGPDNREDFYLYVMYDQSTDTTTIDAMYADGTKPNEIFIKEQDKVVWKQLEPGYLPGLKVTLTYPNSSTQKFSHTGAEILAAWSASRGAVVCEVPDRGVYLAAVGPMYNGDALHAFLFKEYIWSDANGVTEREYLVPADSKTVDVG